MPEPPKSEDEDLWEVYRGEVLAVMATATDPNDDDLATLNVFRNTGSRGSDQQFLTYLSGQGPISDDEGTVFVRRGCRDGLTAEELFARTRRSHWELVVANVELDRLKVPYLAPHSWGHGVRARARRTQHPGPVIGRAASRGESDPLTDVEARLLMRVAG